MRLRYTAKKIPGAFLEPLFGRRECAWQSHHVTNPAAFRLTGEERVLLGYRAGGDRDHFTVGRIDAYSSALGLAVLSGDGTRVVCRFPYPILWIERRHSLPQSPAEYADYRAQYGTELAVLHDFRIYVHGGYVYVNYHDGTVDQAFDRLCRMPENLFRQKVDGSIALAGRDEPDEDAWKRLWHPGDWEKLGADGEKHLFPEYDGSFPTKTDVTYFETDAGIQMLRRPIPDISRLPAPNLVGYRTTDGADEMGILECCVRPGGWDNSHIGPNAMSTPARIGDVPVYIDLWHGVHNGAIGREKEPFRWDMYYAPFFSIRDQKSGDLLYWGEEPVVDPDDPVWEEYTRRGRWIQALTHTYILFAGGQVPMRTGETGEDAPFTFYAGAGDTAIVRGEFTIRSLTPPEVLEDIALRPRCLAKPCPVLPAECALEGEPAGWRWTVRNGPEKRGLLITRTLPDGSCRAERPILCRPGYFDSACLTLAGSPGHIPGCYVLMYRGVRWTEDTAGGRTHVAFGLLLLDEDDPERVLYRSTVPIGEETVLPGFGTGQDVPCPVLPEKAAESVPEAVLREIRHMRVMIAQGTYWKSHHTVWLEARARHAHSGGEAH